MAGERDGGHDRDGLYDRCDSCGASFETGEWYPVITEMTEDGDREYYSFCDDGCRAEWADDSVSN